MKGRLYEIWVSSEAYDETLKKFAGIDPECHEVTGKAVYMKYGFQIKTYDKNV